MSVSVFLLLYALISLIAGLFFFFNVFHIARFGLNCTQTNIVLVAYTVLYLAVQLGTLVLLSPVDWTVPLEINLGMF